MERKTALLFPGQGSQRAGMLELVPENEALSRLVDAAEALSGLELSEIAAEGSDEQLSDTRVAQPLLYLTDWAWAVALIESGLEPVAVAGHSLGEITALAVAGVFSVEAGLELVIERSRLMATAAQAVSGTMAAVLGMPSDEIADAIRAVEDVWVANDNAPGQIVISGTRQGVDEASAILTAMGARRVVPLSVAGPFHSPLMVSARDGFAEIVSGTEFSDALVPVYQNTSASAGTDAELIRQRLMDQIVSPVRWTETMYNLVSDGIDSAIEAGPGSVLTGLAKRVEGLTVLSAEAVGIEAVLEEVS